MIKILATFMIVLLSEGVVLAQNRPLDEKSPFKSKVLDGERSIQIYVPDNPKNSLDHSQTKFPVVYVLDGEDLFLSTVATAKVLQRASLMPEVIVVGVTGIKRDLDYSPSNIDVEYMETGGGPAFLSFFESELIPYIESKYPASPHRTLIGHSLGAVFALYALQEKQHVFSNYLAISPSLWWDNEQFAEDWKGEIQSRTFQNHKNLFVTMANEFTLGNDGLKMYKQYTQLKRVLDAKKNLSVAFLDLFQEDHLSTVNPAHHAGLKFLFRDWNVDHYYESRDFDGLVEVLPKLSQAYGFKVYPNYAQLVELGRHFHLQQDYKKAIQVYSLGIEAYPEGLQLSGFLGESYLMDKNLDKAREFFEKGLRLAKSRNSPMTSWFEDKLNLLKEQLHK